METDREKLFTAKEGRPQENTPVANYDQHERTLRQQKKKEGYEINTIIENRLGLIHAEKKSLRTKKLNNGNKLNKNQKRKLMRGSLTYVHETRKMEKDYLELIKLRVDIMHNFIVSGKKMSRLNKLKEEINNERGRERNNLHNFTTMKPSAKLQNLLKKSGGYVPRNEQKSAELGAMKNVKRKVEETLLSNVMQVVGKGKRGYLSLLKKKVKKNYNHIRATIRYFLPYPNLKSADREYIYKSLKLIDRFSINYNRNYRKFQEKPLYYTRVSKLKTNRESEQLYSAIMLTKDRANILRESDKKLGWSLNSSQWYFKEYLRHLESDFYSRVGDIGDVHLIKQRCRKELTSIINKHKTCPSHKEVAQFYTRNIEEYILPSMNTNPKFIS